MPPLRANGPGRGPPRSRGTAAAGSPQACRTEAPQPPMIRSSVNRAVFIRRLPAKTESAHFRSRFRGSGQSGPAGRWPRSRGRSKALRNFASSFGKPPRNGFASDPPPFTQSAFVGPRSAQAAREFSAHRIWPLQHSGLNYGSYAVFCQVPPGKLAAVAFIVEPIGS